MRHIPNTALRIALMVACLFVPLGCQQPPAPQPPGDASSSQSPAPSTSPSVATNTNINIPDASPEPPPSKPPAPPASEGFVASGATQYLPADTLLVFIGDGVQPFVDRLGRQQIKDQPSFKAAYASLVRRATEFFGFNLIEPEFLDSMGIDTAYPFGVALLNFEQLDLARSSIVTFARISDQEKLEKALQLLGSPQAPLTKKVLDNGAHLWHLPTDTSLAVVVRDGFVFVILPDAAGWTHANQIATQNPAQGLSSDAGFAEAVKHLRGAQHTAAIVRIEPLGSMLENSRYAAAQAALSAPDIPPEALSAEAARHALTQALYTGLRFAAVGLEVQPQALRLSIQLHCAPDAPLAKLLRNGQGFPALQRALQDPPLLMLAGQTHPQDVLKHLSLFAQSVGLDLNDLRTSLKTYANTDLDADFLPALTGDAGLALTGDLDAMLSSMDLSAALDALNLTLTFGISDPAPFTSALDRLVEQPTTGLLVKRDPASIYTLPIPHWKTLHIRITPALLVLSTDPALLARLNPDAAPSPPTNGFNDRLTHPSLRDLLAKQDAALIALLDHRWIGGLLLLASRELLPDLPSLPPDASDAQKQQLAALTAVDAQLRPLLDKKYRSIERSALSRLKLLGAVALHMQVSPGMIQFDGGLFFDADNLPAIVESLFQMTWQYLQKLRAGIDPEDVKLRKLLTEHRKLSQSIKLP